MFHALFHKYLEPGEKIVAVFHRHPVVFVPEFFKIALLGFALPGGLWYLFPNFWLLFGLWMFVSVLRLCKSLFVYYHDALLLTSSSIVDVYWNGFFDQTTMRLEYPMLEGVTVEIKGVWRTVFNIGKVSIQRQGYSTPLDLIDAASPRRVERKIMTYHDQFMTSQNLKDSDSLKDLLATMVRNHAKTEGITLKKQEQLSRKVVPKKQSPFSSGFTSKK